MTLPHPRRRRILPAVAFAALVAAAAPAFADDAAEVRTLVFEKIDRGALALKRGDALTAKEELCWAHRRALNNHTAAWYCGRAALAAREPQRAVSALELAVELDPKHLGSGVDLGRAYVALGNVARARAAFFSVLEVRRDHAPAWAGLARVAELTRDDERALELYAQALAANPADATSRLERGELHLRRGRLDQALEDIREAARLRPDETDVQLGLARVLLEAKLYDEALAAARRARALSPKSSLAWALSAEVFLAKDALPEADEAARRALEFDREEPRAMFVLGEVLGRSGKLEDAIAAFAHPREEVLTEAERAVLANARARWTDRRERLAALEAAVLLPDVSLADLLALAEIRVAMGRPDDAAALVLRANDLGLLDGDTARRIALVLGRAGRMQDAERVLAPVATGPDARARDVVNLGVLRELTGDPQGARQSFEDALSRWGAEATPGDTAAIAAHAGLARLALRDGDRARAANALQALLRMGPEDDVATRVRDALARLAPEVKAP